MKSFFAALPLVFLVLGGCASGHQDNRLTVSTVGGQRHEFRIEVARTRDEQARGLMFRESMDADQGMIFPYSPPQNVSFWMKDTPLSLDILFIRPDGTIAQIAANTTPMSLMPISSGEPVIAVLEINAGQSAKRGIAEGDKVDWKDENAAQ